MYEIIAIGLILGWSPIIILILILWYGVKYEEARIRASYSDLNIT